jgi:hypothetical protein
LVGLRLYEPELSLYSLLLDLSIVKRELDWVAIFDVKDFAEDVPFVEVFLLLVTRALHQVHENRVIVHSISVAEVGHHLLYNGLPDVEE